MDSAAEDASSAKSAPLAPSDDDADLISGLDDDVLVRILGLAGDTRDLAARTGSLSRRWRGLWTRVPALRFPSPPVPEDGGAGASAADHLAALERYVSSVDDALARCARSGCALESLSIRYASAPTADVEQLTPPSVHAARGWIRHAFQRGARSLAVEIDLPLLYFGSTCGYGYAGGGEEGKPVVVLDEHPSPARLETMRLALGGARLRLPTAVKFASLTDLHLERIRVAAGGAHHLGRLVSSASCPRLRHLRMRVVHFDSCHEEMRLEADALSELQLADVNKLLSLELRAPSLRVLHVEMCCYQVLRVSAPRLEEVAILGRMLPRRLEVDGDMLPCVRSLKLQLRSHCGNAHFAEAKPNNTSVLLLKYCTSITCLDVTLDGQKVFPETVEMIKSRVQHLPHITSLTVNVYLSLERHNFGLAVANLLTRFCNLRQLSLHLPHFMSLGFSLPKGLDISCNHPDHWKSNEISMVHLQDVELTGLTGIDCELWFMKLVLASAKGLCKVAISFNPHCWQHEGKMDAFEHTLLGGGMRTLYRDTFKLTCTSCM